MSNNVVNILGMSPEEFIAKLIVLFTALPVHEYAHAATADRLGDDTPYKQGRLTLNPFAHLSIWGSLSLLFFGFGWANPVQIDARNFKHPKRDMAISAFMGPVSNLIMALIGMIGFKVSSGFISHYNQGGFAVMANFMFFQILWLNLRLAVFNLIPIPPVDGSKLLTSLLPNRVYYKFMRYESAFVLVLVLLLYVGVLEIPMSWTINHLIRGLDFVTRPVDMLMGLLG